MFRLTPIIYILSNISLVYSVCTVSWQTQCDTASDIAETNKELLKDTTDLVIGSESSYPTSSFNVNQIPFDLLPNLQTLSIVNYVKDYNTVYSPYSWPSSNLEHVTFYGNNLTVFHTNFLPYWMTTHIHRVSLKQNNIHGLNLAEIASFKVYINILDVSDNKLTDIFPPDLQIAGLKRFICKNNMLDNVHSGSFPESLEILELDHNKLHFLDLSANTALKALHLSGNSFGNMDSITISSGNLEKMDISHNKIDQIPIRYFKEFSKIKVLDLSSNLLTNVDFLPSLFDRMQLAVNLGFNRISDILVDGAFLQPPELVNNIQVWLFGNPLSCKHWADIYRDLGIVIDECDLMWFSSGLVPYCVSVGDYEETSREIVAHFHRAIQENRHLVERNIGYCRWELVYT